MRFSIFSSLLNARLNLLSKVIVNSSSLPLLNNFLFNIKDGVLIITASDSENSIVTRVELVNNDADFSFAVENKTILESLKTLQEQVLNFVIDENNVLKIEYANGHFNIPVITEHNYPTPKSVGDDAVTLTIAGELLYNNICRSLFAVANDDLRPIMNGICFNQTEDFMDIVASDGHVLVRNRLFSFKTATPDSFILPHKPALLLKTLLQKCKSEVVIRYDNYFGTLSFGDYTMTFRLIEGRYPNYNSVIPTNSPNVAEVNRKSLLGVVKRVLPFSSNSNLVKVEFKPSEMKLNAEDFDFNMTASETLSCSYNGDTMNIGFKGVVFASMLNVLDVDSIYIKMSDAARAAIVSPTVQPEDEDCLLLIMPMLIND